MGTLRSFVLLIVVTAMNACSASAGTTGSGITGRAVLGPTCAAQRVGQSCTRGYRTTLLVYRAHSHDLVARVHTGRNGNFRKALAAGRYTIEGRGAGLPRAQPTTVTVRAHHFTHVTITFDTGIR